MARSKKTDKKGEAEMNKVFDLTNGFWVTVGKIVDVFVLHLIWLICCIPIVTFGPATTALYYSLMKDVKDENPHYVKSFFKSFKENFKQGAILGIGVLAVGLLLAFALWYYTQQGDGIWNVIKAIAIGMVVLYICVFEYIFPLLAKFDNKTRKLLETAIFMAVKHVGWTILMAVVTIGVYAIIFLLEFFPLLFLGYGLIAFINSYMLNYIFDQYIPKDEEETDNWSLEEGTPEIAGGMAWKAPVVTDEEAAKAATEAESTAADAEAAVKEAADSTKEAVNQVSEDTKTAVNETAENTKEAVTEATESLNKNTTVNQTEE